MGIAREGNEVRQAKMEMETCKGLFLVYLAWFHSFLGNTDKWYFVTIKAFATPRLPFSQNPSNHNQTLKIAYKNQKNRLTSLPSRKSDPPACSKWKSHSHSSPHDWQACES